MLKYSDIKGLSVISITNGSLVGVVDSITFRHQENVIASFIVVASDNRKLELNESNIIGFGSNAIITNLNPTQANEYTVTDENIINVNDLGDAVVTIDGEMIGKLISFYIDKNTKSILELKVNSSNNTVNVKGSDIVCLGTDFIIISGEYEPADNTSDIIMSHTETGYNGKIEHVDKTIDKAFDKTIDKTIDKTVDTTSDKTFDKTIDTTLETTKDSVVDKNTEFYKQHDLDLSFNTGNSYSKSNDIANLYKEFSKEIKNTVDDVVFEDEKINAFYQKNKTKKITKDIPDYNGNLIVKSGDVVDVKFIESVQDYNPQLFDIIEWFLV